ncbi:MAG: DUF4876 domain-containing protein [Prolixibacteraceae bacterium]|nr:DUF4876 domain-containing protein [Prolixibacteraceae bacterium]
MKRVLFIVASFLILGSCLKEPDYHGYKVDMMVDFGDDFPQGQKAGAKVVLFNQAKAYKVEAVTDQQGKVQFSTVEPGFYSVTVSYSLVQEESVSYLNGIKTIHVFGAVNDTVKVFKGRLSPFVIKEYYYSGTNTVAGKPYSADQYIEIVNNTDMVQYADGISVLEHESYGNGENFWANIKDTIVVKLIWTIPGNGKEVPVLPGKSIVLAQDGINHRDDPNGNPLSPVNLGNADFEFYVDEEKKRDIDFPAVPNLEEDLFVFRAADVAFHVSGGSALAIAKIPGNNKFERMQYINSKLVSKTSASGSNVTYYAKIANKYVLDAVEVVQDEARSVYKRFPQELDAGYTLVASGSRSGKCIRRKVYAMVQGRTIYQDTNNSTEDFLKDVDPRPKIYE